jgi:hypothetical protein
MKRYFVLLGALLLLALFSIPSALGLMLLAKWWAL